MRKLHSFLLAIVALALLSWTNTPRLCQHFSGSRKFSPAAVPMLTHANELPSANAGELKEPLMAGKDTLINLDWQTLRDVRYKRKYHAEYDEYFEYPIFGSLVKALDRKKVEVQGYIIPLGGGAYALSKNPYAACFFCGGAGPETVIGLNFAKAPKRLKVDDYLRIRGIFRLNEESVEQFMYQLHAAEIAP
jgi:hypothetical protein